MANSANSLFLDATTFNPAEDIKYSKPKTNKSGGKSVNILSQQSSAQLSLSTPLMLTWGVNEFVDDMTGRKSYDLSLQFPNEGHETEGTTKFLENIEAFAEQIKKDAHEKYSKEWFNKSKMSPEVIDALFHPMLRYPVDKNTGEQDPSRKPTMKIKLNYWEGKFDNTELYDVDGKLLFPDPNNPNDIGPMELIPKGTHIATIIKCGGLWFANGKFGCTWRLVQAIVKPRTSLQGKCHIQLSTNDKKIMEKQDEVPDENHEDDDEVEDSDDDATVEPSFSAPTPVPEPPKEEKKVVKKKVVRKKVASAAE